MPVLSANFLIVFHAFIDVDAVSFRVGKFPEDESIN